MQNYMMKNYRPIVWELYMGIQQLREMVEVEVRVVRVSFVFLRGLAQPVPFPVFTYAFPHMKLLISKCKIGLRLNCFLI